MMFTAYTGDLKFFVDAQDVHHAAWRVGAFKHGDWRNMDCTRPVQRKTDVDGGHSFDIVPKKTPLKLGSVLVFDGIIIDDGWDDAKTILLNYSPIWSDADKKKLMLRQK